MKDQIEKEIIYNKYVLPFYLRISYTQRKEMSNSELEKWISSVKEVRDQFDEKTFFLLKSYEEWRASTCAFWFAGMYKKQLFLEELKHVLVDNYSHREQLTACISLIQICGIKIKPFLENIYKSLSNIEQGYKKVSKRRLMLSTLLYLTSGDYNFKKGFDDKFDFESKIKFIEGNVEFNNKNFLVSDVKSNN